VTLNTSLLGVIYHACTRIVLVCIKQSCTQNLQRYDWGKIKKTGHVALTTPPLRVVYHHRLGFDTVYQVRGRGGRRITKSGGRPFEVGIADKKWGSNAAYGPRTRKRGGQLTPGPHGSAASGLPAGTDRRTDRQTDTRR